MASTFIFQEEWKTRLAQRLDKPQTWKDTCDVIFSDSPAIVYTEVTASDEPSVSTGQFTNQAGRSTLSNVIPFADVTQTTQTLTIGTTDVVNVYIDYANQAQSNFGKAMEMADLLAKKRSERIEAIILGNHADWTDFGSDGAGGFGLATTKATISESNIDNAVRGIIEEIQTANGWDFYMDKGGFCVWQPPQWTSLVTFMQANGFTFADEALRDGGKSRMGKETLGLFHYVSNDHTTDHLMAGVRGIQKLGILNSTFRTYFADHPASSTAGFLSGTSVYNRLDYGDLVLAIHKPLIFDFNINS